MNKSLLLLVTTVLLALGGCSTMQYEHYAKAAEASSVARSKALADIAAQGDSSAKVAAVMALALGAGQQQLQAPAPNEALQWAQVLVPGLTQALGMRYNYLSTVAQSNNAAAVAVSTNATMQGIAGQIQSPGATSTTTSTINNALSGTGTLGSGAYSTSDNHTTTSSPIVTPVITNPTVITPVVQVVPVIQPSVGP